MSPPIGRPPLVSAAGVESLMDDARRRDDSCQSFTYSTFLDQVNEVRKKEIEARGGNRLCKLKPPSKSSRLRYRKKIVPESCKSAGIKNPTRLRALVEIYNALNAVSLVSLLQDCPNETFVSIDDVGIELGDRMGSKETALLAKGSRARLAVRNKQPSTVKKQKQYRLAHCLVAHTAAGQYCCGIQIRDETFSEIRRIDINEHLCVWFLPTQHDHSQIFHDFVQLFVIPMVDRERKQIFEPDPAIQPDHENMAAPEPEPINHTSVRAILSFDGESSQIAAATAENLNQMCRAQNIELIKWAAATSLVQQPADVGRMHLLLHKYFHPVDGTASKQAASPSSKMKKFVENIFSKCSVPAASKETYTNFLQHIESALSSSFNKSVISDAWEHAGYFPFSPTQIMSGYAFWEHMESIKAEKILEFVKKIRIVE